MRCKRITENCHSEQTGTTTCFQHSNLRNCELNGKCPIRKELLLFTSVCPVFRLIRSSSQVSPVWTTCCGNVSQHPKPRINYTLVITPHSSLYVSPAIITYLLLTASPLSALQLFWTLCFLLFVSLSSDPVVFGVQYETVKDRKGTKPNVKQLNNKESKQTIT